MEQLALARVLIEKGRESLIDMGFNRYAFNDEGPLPPWCVGVARAPDVADFNTALSHCIAVAAKHPQVLGRRDPAPPDPGPRDQGRCGRVARQDEGARRPPHQEGGRGQGAQEAPGTLSVPLGGFAHVQRALTIAPRVHNPAERRVPPRPSSRWSACARRPTSSTSRPTSASARRPSRSRTSCARPRRRCERASSHPRVPCPASVC